LESWDEDIWLDNIIEQIKEQTGVELTQDKFIEFKNYLGRK